MALAIEQKLMLKPGERVFLMNAPKNAPEFSSTAKAPDLADAVLLYAVRETELKKLGELLQALHAGARICVCYPRPGKLDTDLGRDKVWMFMSQQGCEPGKILQVDDTWSAFWFTRS
jgi:hypothetical protein